MPRKENWRDQSQFLSRSEVSRSVDGSPAEPTYQVDEEIQISSSSARRGRKLHLYRMQLASSFITFQVARPSSPAFGAVFASTGAERT